MVREFIAIVMSYMSLCSPSIGRRLLRIKAVQKIRIQRNCFKTLTELMVYTRVLVVVRQTMKI